MSEPIDIGPLRDWIPDLPAVVEHLKEDLAGCRGCQPVLSACVGAPAAVSSVLTFAMGVVRWRRSLARSR